MDVRVRVGRNLRRYRRARGVSQEELADLCELDRTYVSGIERGLRNPTVVVLEQLANVLGVAPGLLLEEDARKPPSSGDPLNTKHKPSGTC